MPDVEELKRILSTPLGRAVALNVWAEYAYSRSKAAGWWGEGDESDPKIHALKISLIHSEVSEALEGIRKRLPDAHLPQYPAVTVELGDALIRIFDLAGAMGLEIGEATVEKDAYNQARADHKPEAREAPGGKTF